MNIHIPYEAIVISVVFIWFLSVFWIGSVAEKDGYKNGQIDSINKKIKFMLKTKDDGSTEWVKKED